MHRQAEQIQKLLRRKGYAYVVVELPKSTHTAKDAARTLGCSVGQIAKSIVFRTTVTMQAVLVISSGVDIVDEKLVEAVVGQPVTKAGATYVRERTGYVIGGVPPVGHPPDVCILVDAGLLKHDRVWAAAGTPHAVFELDSRELCDMTGGRLVCVTRQIPNTSDEE